MGGKGRRRREKNYTAAHGGDTRLPPPPKVREMEAIPSKLRLLMKFKNATSDNKTLEVQETEKDEKSEKTKQKAAVGNAKENNPKKTGLKTGTIEKSKLSKEEISDANINSDPGDVKEKKKKRKVHKDLRFENLDAVVNTRKKKRKEYLDAKKKKHKKEDEDEIRNFPGREQIKFGEVVQAPPKLTVPKMPKGLIDASKERLRLQAIEEYRNRRGWVSRPGIQLPTQDTPTL